MACQNSRGFRHATHQRTLNAVASNLHSPRRYFVDGCSMCLRIVNLLSISRKYCSFAGFLMLSVSVHNPVFADPSYAARQYLSNAVDAVEPDAVEAEAVQPGVVKPDAGGSDAAKPESIAPESVVSGAVRPDVETPYMIALLDGEILFGLGEYELLPEGRLSLRRLIHKLTQFEKVISIRVIGHTDNVGSVANNQALSTRRAQWIAQQFKADYPDTHFLVVGAGESAPVFSNTTEAGRQRNRRVEVQVIAAGHPVP